MRRRLLIADAVRLGGACLTISAAAALALTLADRFIALSLPWWVIGVVALSGFPVACAIAWRRRSAGLSAAVILDDSLRLKDRLGTAMALGLNDSTERDSAMGRLVHEDAERLAAGVDPRAAAQVEWPLSWGAALLVALCCVPLLLFVRPRNIFASNPPTPEQVAALDARQQAAQAIRQRAEQLRQGDVNDRESQELADSQAKQQALDTLDRLARQFDAPPPTRAPGGSTAPGAPNSDAELSSAARQAIELADRLDQQSQIEREAQKRALEGLSDVKPPSASGGADEFADSLRQGDLAAANRWLEGLEDRMKNAPPAEREALANSLRQTAEQIRQAAARQEQPETSLSDSPQQKLEDLGVTPEQIEQWTEQPPSVDDIRRALQDQGQDAIDAQNLAQQAQRDLAQQAAEEKARHQLEETARRVSDLADSVQPPPPPAPEQPSNATPPDEPQDQPKSGADAQPGATTPDAATPPSTSDKSKDAADAPGEQKNPDAAQSSGENGESKSATDRPQPGEKPTETTKPGASGKPIEAVGPEKTTRPGETSKPGEATEPGKDGQPQESPAKAPGESPLTKPVPKESDDPDSRPGAQALPKEGAEPASGAAPKTGEPPQGKQGDAESREGAKPEPGTDPQPGAPAPEAPGAQGKPEPGAASSPGESPDSRSSDARVTPSTEPGGEPSTGEGHTPGSVADRVNRLRDTLDQIDRSGKSADRGQEISREMRDAAKDLLDRMSPEEREELQRWAKAKSRENEGGKGTGPDGSPMSLLDRTLPTQAVQNPRLFDYDTQDVDLTTKGETPNDRVIAEMYGPDQQRPEGAVDRQPMNAAPMREAAQAIERALNEEAIPPRYRSLIRNWARRLPKAPEPAPAPAESPSP